VSVRARLVIWILVVGLLPRGVAGAASDSTDPYADVNDSWDHFGAVYSRVLEHYYSDPDNARIMRAAIDGLLGELDLYSQFFDEEGLRQLRQDTSGRFAGLGITVGIKDRFPVVISPIEGSPAHRAGLLPGDLIVAIEGGDTFGMSLEQVVRALRGDLGTQVRITVARTGARGNRDLVLEREVIVIESVSLVSQITPEIGYVGMRQTRFSEDTATEVAAALDSLMEAGIEAIILDLRGNPGGLLSQAVEVADLFLEEGDPIVTIRERAGEGEDRRESLRPPRVGELPLVVLIDGGSASAAEIVAGAVQDNDRGVVVGTTSFGKGSVQTIFDLHDVGAAALKLTTALYFTPSGRSIHRHELSTPRGAHTQVAVGGGIEVPIGLLLGMVVQASDPTRAAAEIRTHLGLSEALVERLLSTPLGDLVGSADREPESTEKIPTPTDGPFHTDNGRLVYGGGGISPDLHVEKSESPPYIQSLQRQRLFFDFIVDYVGSDSVLVSAASPPAVDDRMMAAFRAFIQASDRAAHLGWDGREEVEALRELSASAGWDAAVLAAIDTLDAALARQRSSVFPTHLEPHVRAGLKRELSLRIAGRRASLLVDLEDDPQIRAAVHLLEDEEQYTLYLHGN